MPLKDVIYHTLLPYKEQLDSWTYEEITDLFLGFGNVSIYFTNDEDHASCNSLAGSFRYNGECIADALSELGVKLSFEYLDFYWGIASGSGTIRDDLNHALANAGFTVYEHFNADFGDEHLIPIETVEGMKMLNLEDS